jgi:hypothetical protein
MYVSGVFLNFTSVEVSIVKLKKTPDTSLQLTHNRY